MTCGSDETNVQPFPKKGKLRDASNLTLATLQRALGTEGGVVYCYVVDSVTNEGGRLVQRGSGPNLQGGMVTLCTCKHQMRTSLSLDGWEGKWIAGFTGVGAGGGRNALVYLTKVAHAFESHQDLWYSEKIPAETKQAKSASLSRLGDLFEPVDGSSDPFDHRGYRPPRENHSHAPDDAWHGDVDRTGYGGRRPALLAGDPEATFMWDTPAIFFPDSIGRGYRKISLGEMISHLESD